MAPAVLLGFTSACSRTGAPEATEPTAPTPPASNSVLRVHWIGKQKLGVAASAYSFMRVWNQLYSRQYEATFMDQLASAPWRLITNQPPSQTAPIPEVSAMLDNVLNEECCLEVRQSDGVNQCVLAIRLDEVRAANWNRQLANVISSLEGNYASPHPSGWTLLGQRSGTQFDLELVGGWVVFGIAKGANPLFIETKANIAGGQGVPFTITTNFHWLALEADTRWLWENAASRNDAQSTINQQPFTSHGWPRASLQLSGNGAYVITTGELTFSQPLGIELKPWTFPKSQVQGAVIGFSAARGTSALLAGTKVWKALQLGEAPDQIFTWADARDPKQIHLAAAVDNPEELIKRLGTNFAPKANRWAAEHALGGIAPLDGGGICWKDLPMIAPYLRAAKDGDRVILEGGLVPNTKPGPDAPPEIYPRPTLDEHLAVLKSKTNLVAYEWETTGARAEATHTLGQLLRVILRHPQMPAETGSSQWLFAARPRLANTTTLVTLAGPNKLAFERKSTTGFNALELHLLADWLESPQFPRGFYSTLSPVGEALKPVGKQ